MENAKHDLSFVVSDFSKVAHLLQETAYEIIRRKVSSTPLFVCAPDPPRLGRCLIMKGEHSTVLHYHASALEELSKAKFVTDQTAFLKVYKNPEEYCCLLLAQPTATNFLFLPYPEDNT